MEVVNPKNAIRIMTHPANPIAVEDFMISPAASRTKNPTGDKNEDMLAIPSTLLLYSSNESSYKINFDI
jgi:hypothetical protein